ncbi:MAG: hypothetical protein ATN36_03475 [Epulopiscium sp. Nele67-Bin005]|nr:MAG: hypothetical protein ATN36_03475 [Epulopiscium sp. Nele67-Bin005]
MKTKKFLLTTMYLGLIGTSLIYADELTQVKENLEANEQEIEQTNEEITKNQEEQAIIDEQIRELDTQVVAIENELLDLYNQLSLKREEIRQTSLELEQATAQRDEYYETTKDRMVTMYKNNKRDYIQIIFSSNNFVELLNRAKYISVISRYDNQVLEEFDFYQNQVTIKKNQLEVEQQQMETLYDATFIQKQQLAEVRQQKYEMMGILETQENELNIHLMALEKAGEELEEKLKALTPTPTTTSSSTSNSSSRYLGGQFSWPVPNYYRISSEYNPRSNPITGSNEFHQGIDIPAAYGEPVLAAADGVVITSGWVNGFGYTIMIDHGGGLVTIYAHNSSLTVPNGTKVSQGQQVAKIGSTGFSTGNHCHFEVRLNGTHTNPWNYLNR